MFMSKSAIVVGGSNGIGLAITLNLINKGYFVYIVDKVEPDKKYLKNVECYEYIDFDLNYFDESVFISLSQDSNIDLLMITAGFGRVSRFEHLDYIEIEKQFNVNTLSIIHIIKLFYKRIMQNENFYTGVICSIAGIVSSPLFSTYSASKSALIKFLEAINIELEKKQTHNRILAVSPGSLNGTKFNGSSVNDLTQVDEVSSDILEKMFNHETAYIPKYNEVYKDVINRYYQDSHLFGINSYDYKINNGRLNEKKSIKIGYLSGTFDLFHIGHLNLLRNYDMLFVGSDYKGTERFNMYEKFFKDKDVKIIYLPYTTTISSTKIREKIINNKNNGDKI